MEAVEEFCLSAQKQWPNCLIQFEDFPTDKVLPQVPHGGKIGCHKVYHFRVMHQPACCRVAVNATRLLATARHILATCVSWVTNTSLSVQAFDILEKMRKKVLCFNDDIQGTGAVVTTG